MKNGSIPQQITETLVKIVQQEMAMKVFKDPTLARDLPGLIGAAVEETVKLFDKMSVMVVEGVADGSLPLPPGVDPEAFKAAVARRKAKE